MNHLSRNQVRATSERDIGEVSDDDDLSPEEIDFYESGGRSNQPTAAIQRNYDNSFLRRRMTNTKKIR